MNIKKNLLFSFLSVFLIFSFFGIFTFCRRLNNLLGYGVTLVWDPPQKPKTLSLVKKIPSFSLEKVFISDHSWTNNFPQDKIVTLITTGDVIPARSVNWKMTRYNDFTRSFLKTADFLQSADLTLINLESPLIANCPVTNEGMVFCGNQKFVEGLKFAGIDVVNLANNHTGNWGIDGLSQTINLLKNNGVLSSGFDSQLATKTLKGTTFGFLGFNLLDKFDQLDQFVQSAKSQVDFLIVSCHWGAEYQRLPSPETVALAHKFVDAGADLVVGNHPHWFQPLEIYQGKLIIYAHGNFIFDQEWSQETKTGFVTKLTIYRGKIVDAQIFPIFIEDYNQPSFLEGKQKEAVLEELKRISLQAPKSQE